MTKPLVRRGVIGYKRSMEYKFLNEKQVAEMLGIKVKTLQRHRLLRSGPPWRKLMGSVRYNSADLHEWLANRPRGGDKVGQAA